MAGVGTRGQDLTTHESESDSPRAPPSPLPRSLLPPALLSRPARRAHAQPRAGHGRVSAPPHGLDDQPALPHLQRLLGAPPAAPLLPAPTVLSSFQRGRGPRPRRARRRAVHGFRHPFDDLRARSPRPRPPDLSS